MEQETPSIQKPDCPYPKFQEITIEQIGKQGKIIEFGPLVRYLGHVITLELMMPLAPVTSPTLAQACKLIIKLLTRSFPLSRELSLDPVYTFHDKKYTHSPLILDYEDPCFPGPDLAQYDSVAYWHGGIVGLNEAHWEILGLLAKLAHRHNGIIVGFERNEYLATKGRETLRPWELIVTVSIFCHLARIYRIPLRVFIMPPFPGLEADLNKHYMDIYKRVLLGNPKTPIVTTLGDSSRFDKKERMKAVGLTHTDWEWTNLKILIQSPSTTMITVEREEIYRSLLEDTGEPLDPNLISRLSLWHDLHDRLLEHSL